MLKPKQEEVTLKTEKLRNRRSGVHTVPRPCTVARTETTQTQQAGPARTPHESTTLPPKQEGTTVKTMKAMQATSPQSGAAASASTSIPRLHPPSRTQRRQAGKPKKLGGVPDLQGQALKGAKVGLYISYSPLCI
jgi:hypothetical protein